MQLTGKPVALAIEQTLRQKIADLTAGGQPIPALAIVRVGEQPDDIAYENRVAKACAAVGLPFCQVALPKTVNQGDCLHHLAELNRDPAVGGVMVFRPLPEQLDPVAISRAVSPEKDVDGMSPINFGRLFANDANAYAPCTAEAVLALLRHYNYNLSGQHVVIVNRSLVLGKPLALMLLNENATITVCHSKTERLRQITKTADIVVTGIGQAGFFDVADFSPSATIIDVGIAIYDGKMCGDVEFAAVEPNVSAITPVPGGIGPVTTMILLSHTLRPLRRAL